MEFFDEIQLGTLWKTYAAANPREAAFLLEIAHKKANQEAYFVPIDFIKTHTGKALQMALLTLPAAPR